MFVLLLKSNIDQRFTKIIQKPLTSTNCKSDCMYSRQKSEYKQTNAGATNTLNYALKSNFETNTKSTFKCNFKSSLSATTSSNSCLIQIKFQIKLHFSFMSAFQFKSNFNSNFKSNFKSTGGLGLGAPQPSYDYLLDFTIHIKKDRHCNILLS